MAVRLDESRWNSIHMLRWFSHSLVANSSLLTVPQACLILISPFGGTQLVYSNVLPISYRRFMPIYHLRVP